jgi:class 3 adenylate cyclase/energy-coupling factor transporter ATP-binding protein EcfA2
MATCAQCGHDNPEAAKFCMECGGPLAPPQRAGEERRLISVLFVDLVGSTARAEQLDPEDVAAFLTSYYEHVRGELERFGGTVEKFVGDAVMGIFGAPTAYGDDPERAVRAALAVRDWAEADGLQVRIAVNTGDALVDLQARPSHGEAMIAGDVVNTASRLQGAAPVGSVLVGEETYASTRGVIEYRPAQPLTLKGKQSPVHAWLALHPTTDAGERAVGAAPLVGRQRELGLLTGTWARVADGSRAQFVTVFGPSGIGKTRLSLELSQLVAAQGGRVIRGRSTPYGASTPYSAFAQQVKQVARIFDSDEADPAYVKLSAAVAELAGPAAAEEHVPHLATLLGLASADGVDERETLFFSARVLVESLALQGPTLLLYEDIHWADESLLDLLETFASRVHDVPVFFVALARPDLLTSRPAWCGGVSSYTALQLDPLSPEASRELARQLLASAQDERAAAVADTAEGNPLFIEELSASLAERSTADSGRLPTSVQAIVAARLDALPPDERRVLVDASVVGRVFWRGALNEIAPRDDLAGVLGSLEARDLIRREAVSRISGDQQFGFKHGLIHEVAYSTLPRPARRERHAAVARFLAGATAVGQSHEALAHHWHEAGETERALDELEAAADQAGQGWAKERAIKLYGEALELVPEGDDARRKRLRMRQIVAVQALAHLHQVDVPGVSSAGPDPPSAGSHPA